MSYQNQLKLHLHHLHLHEPRRVNKWNAWRATYEREGADLTDVNLEGANLDKIADRWGNLK